MRASMLLRSAAKPKQGPNLFPWEVYPLFACMGLVSVYAGYRLYANYMADNVRAGHQAQNTARLPESKH